MRYNRHKLQSKGVFYMLKRLLSMKMAVLMLFLFGILIGAATFIENDYGTQTARALIYKAKWFELFLAYFTAILLYQILQYKSYTKKFSVFLFHFSFFLVAIGALITRYVGYEGIMHIREGQESNLMVSDAKILQIYAKTPEANASVEEEVYFSTLTPNHLSESLDLGNKSVKVRLKEYLPTVETKVVEDSQSPALLEMKISAGAQGKLEYFRSGEIQDFGGFYVAYNAKNIPNDKPVFKVDGPIDNLTLSFPYDVATLNMESKASGVIKAGKNPLTRRMLYRFGGNAVVLKSTYAHAKTLHVSHDFKTKSGKAEWIVFDVAVGDVHQEVVCEPRKGKVGKLHNIHLNGVDIALRLGAKIIELPFSIKLVDFQLERYPGSMTPASYASEVVLIDKEQNINKPYRIYMNHILDHRNYRFFQSSYDPDEKGTVLSVNHDPGTWPTYIAYILMGIGMLWSLFSPYGRFQKLLKGARKLQEGTAVVVVALFLAFAPQGLKAATPTVDEATLKQMEAYAPEHALKFSMLAVQDHAGRMKPMDTVAHDVISKISGKSTLFGLESSQIFLGMMMQPSLYQNIAMIKIGHPKIALDLGLPKDAKFATFADFFNAKDNSYKLFDVVTKASRKKPLEKTKYDKELLKIDERVNVSYMVYQGTLLRIFPKPNDANNKWYAPMEALKAFTPEEIADVGMRIKAYFMMVAQGVKTGDWEYADKALVGIQQYQQKYGAAVLPSPKHIEMEIWYNKLGLFGKLVPLYLLLGLLLLVFAFINVLKPSFSMKWIMRGAWTLLSIGFALHIIGLGIRWYIAGHAPWSNAYESIVFIAASTVFAGIILARRSPFALAGTAILAGVTMGVAHMNFINPEITNLVPVLKSYWLMIHVAGIISGDGFFGLGSILSLLVLILYILRGKEGNANIDRSIKELSNLSEMALIIGLYLFTVGNFLGGVWANESWGRYWGWDSKETWAAVTILIYAGVLHLRFIPALKSKFVYNVATTWAYFTVLMTYFGVNYYLSGLHSYAAGDPIPMPVWVYYGVAGLLVLTLVAARNRKLK